MASRHMSLHAPAAAGHRRDPAHPPIASLMSEAHRIAHRRAVIEAACRTDRGPHGSWRARRLATRRARLAVTFHAALDRLFAANAFDEALDAFRAYRAEVCARVSPPPRSAFRGAPATPIPARPSGPIA